MADIKVKKAKSYTDLTKQNFKTFAFTGEFKESFGEPETNGTWLIWGGSFSGKTDFALKLSKYLSNFGKVFYDTLEERGRQSFRLAYERNYMKSCGSKFQYEVDDFETLKARLSMKRSPKIVIIDSLQYLRITTAQYKELQQLFPKVLFIFISHAKGSEPKGATAIDIRYDADVKIEVKDFVAKVESRFGGGKPFVIWEKGMREAQLKLT